MTKISYVGYRFPPEIIRQAIWLYLRVTLSLRDVEDLLAECGIVDDCPVLADEDRLADAKLFDAGADPSDLRGFLARLSQLAG